MKANKTLVFLTIITSLLTVNFSFVIQNANAQTSTVTFDIRGDGQAYLTADKVHTSNNSIKLVMPSGAQASSWVIALYPYNKAFSTITSFGFYTSYTVAVPRFVIYIDNNIDSKTDFILLSDYQNNANGDWQLSNGGSRWGWTMGNYELSRWGQVWDTFENWKVQYPNATVLYLGVCLQYTAVGFGKGYDKPLYADELIVNGKTCATPTSATTITIQSTPTPTPTPPSTSNWDHFKISGYVTDSNGRGLEHAMIIFNVPELVPAVYTDNAGYFEMQAPQGYYQINVWPPWDSNYIYYRENQYHVTSEATKNITLNIGYKVSGYITDNQGTPMTGACVFLNNYLSGWFSNSSGYYFLSVPDGIYTIDVHPRPGSYMSPTSNFPTYYEYNFVVTKDTPKNITVGDIANATATPIPTCCPTSTPKPLALATSTPSPLATPNQTPNPIQTQQEKSAPPSESEPLEVEPTEILPQNWVLIVLVTVACTILAITLVKAYRITV